MTFILLAYKNILLVEWYMIDLWSSSSCLIGHQKALDIRERLSLLTFTCGPYNDSTIAYHVNVSKEDKVYNYFNL